MSELSRKLEALLFISSSPLTERELKEFLQVSSLQLRNAIQELQAMYENENHGIFLSKLANGYIFQTKPELYEAIKSFQESKGTKKINLSKAAIETIAIIAYNQPITRTEIENIRGVNSDSIVARLLEYGLIQTAGKKDAPGQPLMFRTTKRFLETFGLESIKELPVIEDQKELTINYET